MFTVTSVAVRRFKQLEELELPLGAVTVLIGANNAGKSSFLQALHLAVSVAQTVNLVAEGASWAREIFQTTISPEQLLYSPVSDVLTLATGGRLEEARATRIEIEISTSDGLKTVVALKRGRNRNLSVSIEGRKLGEKLMDLEHPFTVYAPGLAGIARSERLLSAGVVRRTVARGDANLALRNVLRLLAKNEEAWQQYIEDMRKFFPGLDVIISFDEHSDEFVEVFIKSPSGTQFPLDAAGTSILQASQILAYVSLFKPQILILDEPDSHLHPDNQKKLCRLLLEAANERGFQVIVSTHSRHMLDAMREGANIIWLSQGTRVPNEDASTASMLLDIGALDSPDLLSDTSLRCLVVTEDTSTEGLHALLWSSGFVEDETETASYAGCSKTDAALVLGRFLEERASHIKVVVHRDSDYLSDEAVKKIKQNMAAAGVSLFLTEFSDIEGYFLNSAHLHALNSGISVERLEQLIDEAINACTDESVAALINQRTTQAFAIRKTKTQVDHGRIAVDASSDYKQDPRRLCRGKVVLKKLTTLMQAEIKTNPRIYYPSPYLLSPSLKEIVAKIWDKEDSNIDSEGAPITPESLNRDNAP